MRSSDSANDNEPPEFRINLRVVYLVCIDIEMNLLNFELQRFKWNSKELESEREQHCEEKNIF